MSDTLTYVYCLVRRATRPSKLAALDAVGVPGGTGTRAIALSPGLWMIAATVPASAYDQTALAVGLQALEWVGPRAVAHARVVGRFLTAPAVLPMRLCTLFLSDDRAVAHMTRNRRALARILARLERRLEWGVRLTFDEAAARAAIERDPARRADVRGGRSGLAYLARKRDLLDVTRTQLATARTEASRVYRAVSRTAAAARRRTATEQATPGSRLLLDAAFLVDRGQVQAFRTALRAHTRALAPAGVTVSLTGPWPPYNFIDRPGSTRRG